MHHPDEPNNIRVVDAMVVNGDPNPHFFNYPSLFLYLNAAVHFDGPLLGWIPGLGERAPISLVTGVTLAPTPPSILAHRLLTVLCGVLVVLVGWLTARRVSTGILPPLVTAALLAFSPTLVAHSKLITPDMFAALLVGVGVLCAMWVFQRGTWAAYLVAGASVGVAAGAKYTAVLVGVSLLLAAVLARRKEALVRLPMAAVTAAAAFLVTTPYALLDRQKFLADLEFERRHYATGHDGMEGDTLSFYADLLLSREGALVGAALAVVATAAWFVRDRWREIVILLAFPVVYGISVSLQTVRNDRTIMLVLPPLAVLVALAVDRVPERRHRVGVSAVAAGVALVVALTALPTSGPTTWARAREWFDDRPGTTVLVEAYGPYLDPGRHDLIGRVRMIDGGIPPEVDYIVVSEAMYGRYVTGDHPAEERKYRRLFETFPEAARFTGNGDTLVVLRAR